jgi:hypothetical protein
MKIIDRFGTGRVYISSRSCRKTGGTATSIMFQVVKFLGRRPVVLACHSAAAARHPSMIPLISARQEPQLVPAFVAIPTASTLWHPLRMAETMLLTPTDKQEQSVAPGSG